MIRLWQVFFHCDKCIYDTIMASVLSNWACVSMTRSHSSSSSLCAICSQQVGCHGFYPWLTRIHHTSQMIEILTSVWYTYLIHLTVTGTAFHEKMQVMSSSIESCPKRLTTAIFEDTDCLRVSDCSRVSDFSKFVLALFVLTTGARYNELVGLFQDAEKRKECRYAVFDLEYTTKSGTAKNKLLFFMW